MDSKREEALIAKQHAEKRFAEKDYVGAKNFALKAQMLCHDLEGIALMVATFNIYVAAEMKVNGVIDYYSILGVKPKSGKPKIRRRYDSLSHMMHPDRNRTVGADGAFRLVSEAWAHLSVTAKRSAYDLKRNGYLSSTVVSGATYPNNCVQSSLPPTFWTICTSCQVQYEYLRMYVNKRLSCKNCLATFMAVELGTAPIHGSYPVSNFSPVPDNGYSSSHGCNNMSFSHTNTVHVSGNGVPVYHSGHGSEHASNLSFQWSASPGSSAEYVSPNGFTISGDTFYQGNGYSGMPGEMMNGLTVNGTVGYNQSSGAVKVRRPYKKRKVEVGGNSAINGCEVGGAKVVVKAANENVCTVPKFWANSESSVKQSMAPLVDIRSLLIEKARTVIRKKLEELKSASAMNCEKPNGELSKPGESQTRQNLGITQLQPKKLGLVTLTVPDSDFHDFDKDRTEECFQPKQIWALYDEEDGMPRLYCLIRQIISVNPFKVHISYLSSKTDTEFGNVNWIDSGFTKSCGHFRATTSDVVEEVNMFSHVLSREKAGRGGCVRIFPRSGDIWAVYQNWSTEWNRTTPYDVRHQYKLIEVLNDYNEEVGVPVAPLVKLEGYKTVYQRCRDKNAIWWIPRREMVRFSHQVPSWLLKETDLPEGCFDVDPAAIPDELLKPMNDFEVQGLDKAIKKES